MERETSLLLAIPSENLETVEEQCHPFSLKSAVSSSAGSDFLQVLYLRLKRYLQVLYLRIKRYLRRLKRYLQVHDALDHDKLRSAFQIRYGGYKGMLVIDPTLKDTDIVFRESMKKFDSPNNTRLEIAKTKKIKSRANVAIDPSQGRNMRGVMDETGLLNENEVFVQYSKDISYGETTRDTIILKRKMFNHPHLCPEYGDRARLLWHLQPKGLNKPQGRLVCKPLQAEGPNNRNNVRNTS
ncbi:hypothetical protein AVEN_120416-1 [Araneus ventricosus]|uniref:RNA-dependent RNA polymerase n=1 Tax=Araneus ventricosus TaxID=182803 RepID=A0A4Y2S0L9_ARAVE|nr:hypothetical protein AVEN_120416-1 [Araneus ventricosus]